MTFHIPIRRIRPLLLSFALLLCGCGQAAPTATSPTHVSEHPTVARATPGAGKASHATVAPTASAVSTLAPVQTDSPSPTADGSQVTSASQIAAVGPALPDSLEQALAQGQMGRAIALWEGDPPDVASEGALALEIAHAYVAENRPRDAVELLDALAQAGGEQQIQAAAFGLLGGIYADLGEWHASIEAYSQHLALTQAVAPQVMMRVTSAYMALGDDQGALTVLESIDLEALDAADRASVLEDRAELLRRAGRPDEALALYQQILGFAQQTGYRALVRHYYAQTLVEADRLDDALAAWRGILRDAPASYTAILALDALDIHDDAEIGSLQRAEILLNAGRLDAADQVLQAYTYDHTDETLAQAYLLLGDVYVQRGEYSAAFSTYDQVIDEYPDSAQSANAWLSKAAAERAYGGDPTGLYFEFARLYPEHERAPEALWLAGQYMERQGMWDQAQRYYGLVVERYTDSDNAEESTFRQGLMLYANGQYSEALAVWEKSPGDDTSKEEQARWLLWEGLAADKAGRDPRPAWEDAYAAGPLTYYGLRADELASAPDENSISAHDATLDGVSLSPTEHERIEAWVSTWYTDTLQTETATAIDATIESALLMDRMNWHADAMRLLRSQYEAYKADPLAELRLAQACLAQGWYSPMILAANRARWLGQEAGADDAPDALWRLSYPVVYPELLSSFAGQYGLDALLMLALMRQESRFDAEAVSYAGAQGLAQVMPNTGEWIAERVGDAGYRTNWLERPHVSIGYGAWFMRWLLDLYDNDTVASLVAYNAGPGNVNRWTNEEAIADHDLFIETLPLQQPYDYVTWISIQYRMYRRLYTGRE